VFLLHYTVQETFFFSRREVNFCLLLLRYCRLQLIETNSDKRHSQYNYHQKWKANDTMMEYKAFMIKGLYKSLLCDPSAYKIIYLVSVPKYLFSLKLSETWIQFLPIIGIISPILRQLDYRLTNHRFLKNMPKLLWKNYQTLKD
jgi:hypothetical protein